MPIDLICLILNAVVVLKLKLIIKIINCFIIKTIVIFVVVQNQITNSQWRKRAVWKMRKNVKVLCACRYLIVMPHCKGDIDHSNIVNKILWTTFDQSKILPIFGHKLTKWQSWKNLQLLESISEHWENLQAWPWGKLQQT